MKICNFIFFTLIGVAIGGMIYANVAPDKTPQHTSTVSGTSGELKCTTTTCVVKDK
jgi:hypothetical protein